MTSKARLEERHASAVLVLAHCAEMLEKTTRTAIHSENTGHTSLVGEVAAVRRALRALRRRATIVRDRLNDRIKSEC